VNRVASRYCKRRIVGTFFPSTTAHFGRISMRTYLIAAFVALVPTASLAAEYDVDPGHSSASFTVRHMMITNLRGELSGIKGSASWTRPDLADAKIEVTIDANSIDTHLAPRDKHLKSPDFLDVAEHPTLGFKSTRISKHGDKISIAGELTLRGVTRAVTFEGTAPTAEVKDPFGNTRIGASATAKISRKDFGMTWNKAVETGGFVVGDEVTIEITLELLKHGDKKAQR
jgi:polyisoprenoid-binding protein YceI